jgi:hypothetical protein
MACTGDCRGDLSRPYMMFNSTQPQELQGHI